MGIEKVGYRRLYDAVNCSLSDELPEFSFEVPYGEYRINVYMGPKPLAGLYFCQSESKYLTEKTQIKMSYHADATMSDYPRKFFTEILCYKEYSVDNQASDDFHIGETTDEELIQKCDAAKAVILKFAEDEGRNFKQILDLVVGKIGLRFTPRLVKELINENFCVYKNHWQIDGWMSDVLENVPPCAINANGRQALESQLGALYSVDERLRKIYALVMGWLWRAWDQRDLVAKFMAFFTALEVACKFFVEMTPEQKEVNKKLSDEIEACIKAQAGDNTQSLLTYFKSIRQNQAPGLTDCFIAIAEEAKLQGYENDIIAFRKFYRKRNDLIHRGDSEVIFRLQVTEDEVRGLEDLTERYLSWLFYHDTNIYHNPWRGM